MNILSTQRLILREFQPSDADKMFELNADPEVIRYTGDPPFQSIQEAKSFLENYADYQKNGFGRWAAVLKETNKFIGWCGLKLNEQNLVDIGFRFFRSHWNKGFAIEAAKATLDYGFNQLHLEEIIGRAALANKPSIRVLEKLNMTVWKYDQCKGIENAVYYKIKREQFF